MGWNIYHRLIAVVVLFLQPSVDSRSESARFFSSITDPYEKLYGHFQEYERLMLRDEVAEMFWFGYNNYILHAFPMDELVLSFLFFAIFHHFLSILRLFRIRFIAVAGDQTMMIRMIIACMLGQCQNR